MTNPFIEAQRIEVQTPWKKKIKLWLERKKTAGVIFVLFTFGLLSGFTIYEATNSARGWAMIAGSAAPTWIATCFGFVATIGYISFHRAAFEKERDKKDAVKAWRKALEENPNLSYSEAGDSPEDLPGPYKEVLVMIGCAFIALVGVFSNLADKTGKDAQEALEANTSRAELVAELGTIERATTEDKFITARALVDVTYEAITSLEDEAVGWGMEAIPILTDDGVPVMTTNEAGQAVPKTTAATSEQCRADLRTRERIICNELNGPDGLRSELTLHEAALYGLEVRKARGEEIKESLKDMKIEEGNQHWAAMETVAMGSVDSDTIRIWIMFLASCVVLVILGFAWDSFFEAREREYEG